MARRFRDRRFSRSSEIGEDVNPSAYIVNLADCMLVLACGFMVALISFWNIDISGMQELDDADMQEVDPETLEQDIDGSGSYYVEAGTVYRDPKTGTLYLVEVGSATDDGTDENTINLNANNTSDSSDSSSSSSSSSSNSTRDARANGAD